MARITGTSGQIAVELRRRAQAVDRAVRDAERSNLKEALEIARRLSSGAFTTAMLRRMGHPYATRNPHPPADSAIINAQSGTFRAAWRTTGPFATGGGMVSRLYNSARWASWLLHGTALMIARPIDAAIQGRVRDLRYRRTREAVRRAIVEGG